MAVWVVAKVWEMWQVCRSSVSVESGLRFGHG